MTARDLKEQLVGVPDDALILRPGSDHTYRHALVDLTKVIIYGLQDPRRFATIAEDYGDEHNEGGGVRVNALVFS